MKNYEKRCICKRDVLLKADKQAYSCNFLTVHRHKLLGLQIALFCPAGKDQKVKNSHLRKLPKLLSSAASVLSFSGPLL